MDHYTRDLKLDSVGDDVAQLHEQLGTIGFPIAPDEGKRKLFGPTTEQAVSGLQRFSPDALRDLGWQDVRRGRARDCGGHQPHTRSRCQSQKAASAPVPEPAYQVTGAVQGVAGEPMVGATVTVSVQNVQETRNFRVARLRSILGVFRARRTPTGMESTGPSIPESDGLNGSIATDSTEGREARLASQF